MTSERPQGNGIREETESTRKNTYPSTGKFLFISDVGLIGDLAYTIRNEGNEVRYYIASKTDKDISDGFVDKIDDWQSLKSKYGGQK